MSRQLVTVTCDQYTESSSLMLYLEYGTLVLPPKKAEF